MSTKLSIANLDQITEQVAKPNYRRDTMSAGIVHVGVGNFHRAHQSVYLHRLFEMGIDRDWGIIGSGVTKYDDAMRRKLASQDWLTTVVELDPEGLNARITSAMIDFIDINPQLIIHADIVADGNNPDSPQTVFGIVIAALKKRKENQLPPFTLMSCDNLPENGQVAKHAVVGLASLSDIAMSEWIEQHVDFPNSMVDCITPATTEREIGIVKDSFGIDDSAPVVCEPFNQWVLEDKFSNGRPALEKVGVEFVDDVAPYELMKLRILNGGHASIAYLAGLLDIHYVHDAMNNPLVSGYLDKLEHDEIIPTLDEIPGVCFNSYYKKVVERFSNEAVGDTIPRLCFDGLNRQPKFILPVIEARLRQKQSIEGLVLECALWCRYCYGITDTNAQIPANDTQWDRLKTQSALAKADPKRWLELSDVYGELGKNKLFMLAFEDALNSIWEKGTAGAITHYLS